MGPQSGSDFLHSPRNATAYNAARSTFHDHNCDGTGGAMVYEVDTAWLHGHVESQCLLLRAVEAFYRATNFARLKNLRRFQFLAES